MGCVAGELPGESSTAQAISHPYVGEQGRLALGFKDPDVRTFGFPTLATASVVAGELRGNALSGTQLAGLPFVALTNNQSTNMRIANVFPPEPGGAWEYALEQQNPATGAWEPACAEPTQLFPPATPPKNPPNAIALPGSWNGGFYAISGGPMFACKTGVVAKCVSWGYDPALTFPTTTINGNASTAIGADMLQACTRMARADYCGQDVSNTMDGTPIHIDDVFSGRPPVEGYAFEAAWTGRVSREGRAAAAKAVVCLSKLRWSTLPLGGNCPLTVPDPRVDSKGKFCEDMSATDMELKGALTYSSSSYIDAGLYAHTDPSTGLRLTTTKLLPQASGLLPAWQIPAPSGVPFPAAGQTVRFEATIFGPALPPGLPDTGLIKLFSYRCPADLVTTTSSVEGSCSELAHEGYIYLPHTPGRAPLRRWYSPTTKTSFTTVAAASTMLANGWQLAEVVGAVIRASLDVNVRWSAVANAAYTIDVQTRASEWVNGCIGSTQIGAATSYAFTGKCVGAANRIVDHSDIIAFRVNATVGSTTTTATASYDGVASDAYVPLAGTTTAVAVQWNDLGSAWTYQLDVSNGASWTTCAPTTALANDTSYLHTLKCPSGKQFKLTAMPKVRVCAVKRGESKPSACAEAAYDGVAPALALTLKM